MGAHFEALDKGVLVAALISTGYFLPFRLPRKCGGGIHVDNQALAIDAGFEWGLVSSPSPFVSFLVHREISPMNAECIMLFDKF